MRNWSKKLRSWRNNLNCMRMIVRKNWRNILKFISQAFILSRKSILLEQLDELQGEQDDELDLLQLEDELELQLLLELGLLEQLEEKLQELQQE